MTTSSDDKRRADDNGRPEAKVLKRRCFFIDFEAKNGSHRWRLAGGWRDNGGGPTEAAEPVGGGKGEGS